MLVFLAPHHKMNKFLTSLCVSWILLASHITEYNLVAVNIPDPSTFNFCR
jgi:hypothetical protein